MIERFVIRVNVWRRYGRLLLAVRVCELLMWFGARGAAERLAPMVGGPLVTRRGLTRLLDALEHRQPSPRA